MKNTINNSASKLKSIIAGARNGRAGSAAVPLSGKKSRRLRWAVLALAAVAGSVTALTRLPITVSNSVNGRELPIYCVETAKKQVALSFDAA